MLFLWRQHLELYVKRLIELARTVHDAEARTPFGHRLPDLWRQLRGLLELEELGDDVRAAIDATDQVMKDLEAVDPNSTHSRYAEGRSGKDQVMSLAGLPEHFDPQHFGAVLSKTSDFFDCVDIEYSSRLDAMAEAMANHYLAIRSNVANIAASSARRGWRRRRNCSNGQRCLHDHRQVVTSAVTSFIAMKTPRVAVDFPSTCRGRRGGMLRKAGRRVAGDARGTTPGFAVFLTFFSSLG